MPTVSRTTKAVATARARLREAIDCAYIDRGEAQWLNGYRAGRRAAGDNESTSEELGREIRRFAQCGLAERKVARLMTAYARAIRCAKK